VIKTDLQSYMSVFGLALTISVDNGRKCRYGPPHFSAHNLLSVDVLSNVTAAYD